MKQLRPKTRRRGKALARLEQQLESGVKTTKEGKTVKLQLNDINRINKEIDVLKTALNYSLK